MNLRVFAEARNHPAGNRASATNRIGLKALGRTFVAYINAQEVVRADDDSVPNGTIRLEVIGPRGNATEGRFDNLVVSGPAE